MIGWREFIRGIYAHYNDEQQSTNYFNHQRNLNHHWWDGTTGHLPLDDAIKSSLKRSYAHHINRLMIIGATMLTTEIKPTDVHHWFMVMYADSSEWVMGPNVFGIGSLVMRVFCCQAIYLWLKLCSWLSHYGQGDWCDIADGLYWRFISEHTEFFAKNARMGLAVKSLEKMAGEKKDRLFKAANQFIEKVTK